MSIRGRGGYDRVLKAQIRRIGTKVKETKVGYGNYNREGHYV